VCNILNSHIVNNTQTCLCTHQHEHTTHTHTHTNSHTTHSHLFSHFLPLNPIFHSLLNFLSFCHFMSSYLYLQQLSNQSETGFNACLFLVSPLLEMWEMILSAPVGQSVSVQPSGSTTIGPHAAPEQLLLPVIYKLSSPQFVLFTSLIIQTNCIMCLSKTPQTFLKGYIQVFIDNKN